MIMNQSSLNSTKHTHSRNTVQLPASNGETFSIYKSTTTAIILFTLKNPWALLWAVYLMKQSTKCL